MGIGNVGIFGSGNVNYGEFIQNTENVVEPAEELTVLGNKNISGQIGDVVELSTNKTKLPKGIEAIGVKKAADGAQVTKTNEEDGTTITRKEYPGGTKVNLYHMKDGTLAKMAKTVKSTAEPGQEETRYTVTDRINFDGHDPDKEGFILHLDITNIYEKKYSIGPSQWYSPNELRVLCGEYICDEKLTKIMTGINLKAKEEAYSKIIESMEKGKMPEGLTLKHDELKELRKYRSLRESHDDICRYRYGDE